MDKELNNKLNIMDYRIKQIEALLLALIESLDCPDSKTRHVKFEYSLKTAKLNIHSDYPD